MIRKEMAILSQNVKKHRKYRNWTRAQLAKNTGFSENWISQIERGTCSASLLGLQSLADAFGVKPGDLLSNEDSPESSLDELVSVVKRYGLNDEQIILITKIIKLLFNKN